MPLREKIIFQVLSQTTSFLLLIQVISVLWVTNKIRSAWEFYLLISYVYLLIAAKQAALWELDMCDVLHMFLWKIVHYVCDGLINMVSIFSSTLSYMTLIDLDYIMFPCFAEKFYTFLYTDRFCWDLSFLSEICGWPSNAIYSHGKVVNLINRCLGISIYLKTCFNLELFHFYCFLNQLWFLSQFYFIYVVFFSSQLLQYIYAL